MKRFNVWERCILGSLALLLLGPLLLGVEAWLFHLTLVLPPLILLVLLVWRKRLALLWCAAYVLAYAFLSGGGSYISLMPGGGRIWYPLGMKNTRAGRSGRVKTDAPNALGTAFWPLLLLDQSLVHPTLDN